MAIVKICGITNLTDAKLACRYGADQIGFNFYFKSPRVISPCAAAEIARELPETVCRVGVFVDEEVETIIAVAKRIELDAIQLHGGESPEFAREVKNLTGLSVIKAFGVSDGFVPADVCKYDVDAVLLDAYAREEHGGTGVVFDWKYAADVKKLVSKLYLAGGLSHINVASAIAEVDPYCVDACSRLESTKGVKDELKLRRFMESAKRTSYEL